MSDTDPSVQVAPWIPRSYRAFARSRGLNLSAVLRSAIEAEMKDSDPAKIRLQIDVAEDELHRLRLALEGADSVAETAARLEAAITELSQYWPSRSGVEAPKNVSWVESWRKRDPRLGSLSAAEIIERLNGAEA